MTPFKYNLEQHVKVSLPKNRVRGNHGIILARHHPTANAEPEYFIRTDYPDHQHAHYAWRTEKLLTPTPIRSTNP